jgi:hypothetical protein
MSKFKYPNDPPDATCPYCGESGKPCSNVDSMTRAYARGICKKKYVKEDTSQS